MKKNISKEKLKEIFIDQNQSLKDTAEYFIILWDIRIQST